MFQSDQTIKSLKWTRGTELFMSFLGRKSILFNLCIKIIGDVGQASLANFKFYLREIELGVDEFVSRIAADFVWAGPARVGNRQNKQRHALTKEIEQNKYTWQNALS